MKLKVTRARARELVWLAGRKPLWYLHIDSSLVVGSYACTFWGRIEVRDYRQGCDMVRRIRRALIGMEIETERDDL